MQIQSLSVVVPGGCPNRCRFCVAHMHKEEYKDHIENNCAFRDLYERDYLDRLSFARDNGCNTVLLSGNGEPLTNHGFLNFFADRNDQLEHPFRWIELQTSGVTMDENSLRWLRNKVRVSTISFSLCDLFSDDRNAQVMRTPEKLKINIEHLCSEIKRYDFNLRLSLNLCKNFEEYQPETIFERLDYLKADQVTFRVLYGEGETDESRWVQSNSVSGEWLKKLNNFIVAEGRELELLPFGSCRYSVNNISTVVDTDCMNHESTKSALRYLILRPNCKLYSRWDDQGSILF